MILRITLAQNLPVDLSKATIVLPAGSCDSDLFIVGPDSANVGDFVHLEVKGLPPIDSSLTIDEALAWTKEIATGIQQPPESEKIDFDVVLGFNLYPVLQWKLTLNLRATVSGDYTVVFALPASEKNKPVRLALHGVRFGSGPVPPPPDPELIVSPQTPFSSTGPPGGPFTPPTKSYLLTNSGVGSLNWFVKTSSDWLVATPNQGTISAGDSVEVFLSFGPKAKELDSGIHAGAATFQNITNGKGTAPRLVVLTIEGDTPPPPAEELWGLLIFESDDVDNLGPDFAQVLYSTRIRTLHSKFHWEPRDIDEQDADGNTPGDLKPWVKIIEEENLEVPHLFLVDQDGNLVTNASAPQTVDKTIDFIKKYLPNLGN